jgi:hypothetical protein
MMDPRSTKPSHLPASHRQALGRTALKRRHQPTDVVLHLDLVEIQRRARKLIGTCHFAHFWRAVTSLAAMQGRRSLKKIEAACRNHQSRQSVGFFLTKAHWDAPRVLAETALDTLQRLGWRAGDPLDLVLDDTQKKKRGKQMWNAPQKLIHGL